MLGNRVLMCVTAIFLTLTTRVLAADVGFRQETPNQWRVSKLVGVAIYGPENQTDGTITDVLMSDNGKAEYVIIGVGVFFGISQKDVAIPFAQVKFSDQAIMPPENPAGFDNALGSSPNGGGTMAANGSIGVAKNGVVIADVPSNAVTAAGVVTQNTSHPDHGMIDLTVEQLRNAPTFKFVH